MNRNVPKLRFKGFEDEWKEQKFKDLLEVIDGDRGINYPKESDFENEGFCLFLNAKNVTKSGFKFKETKFISKEKDQLLRKGKLKHNDIILTTRGTIGNIALYDNNISFNNIRINSGMVLLRALNQNYKYIYVYMKSKLFKKQLNKIVFGSAQPQLTVKDIKNFVISEPSLQEQEKIANFLTKVDNLIEEQDGKVSDLEQYKKGMMQKIFSQEIRFKDEDGCDYPEWKEKRLKNICSINQGLQIPISNRFTEYKSGRYFYITNEFLKADSGKKYYIENPPKSVICNEEDILMTRTGNTGKVVTNVSGAFHNNFFKVDYNRNNIFKMFLYYFLISYKIQKNIIRLAGNSTIPDLNHNDFYNIKIKLPCIEEQTKIANFLSKIDSIIEEEKNKLEDLRQWKKGLLQQMFV